MRIIAGSRKGLKIKMPPGAGVRPVTDRIKESVFGILSDRVRGASVLDLFSGAGSFGVEALSRGARRAVFIDSSPECVLAARQNIGKAGVCGEVICGRLPGELEGLSERGELFDLVFIDPPFASAGEDIDAALGAVCRLGLLAEGATVVARRHFKTAVNPPPPGLRRLREKRYGENLVVFYE